MGILLILVGTAMIRGEAQDRRDLGMLLRSGVDEDLGPDEAPTPPGGLAEAWPSARADPGLELRVAPEVRAISGHVVVRENDLQGTRLNLVRDLGLTKEVGAKLEVFTESATLRLEMEVEELYGWGSRTERRPFNWNGNSFSPPAQVQSSTNMLTVLPLLTWKAIAPPEQRFWAGPVVGLEYPYYTVTVTTTAMKGSLEDWVHFVPYPTFGISGHADLTDRLSLEGRLTAAYLPNLPVPYTEGGRLYVSARPSLRLELPLAWRLGPAVGLSAGIVYQYWSGRDHSIEDGNTLTFSSPGLWLGLDCRW